MLSYDGSTALSIIIKSFAVVTIMTVCFAKMTGEGQTITATKAGCLVERVMALSRQLLIDKLLICVLRAVSQE